MAESNAAGCQETNASMEELKATIDTINEKAQDTVTLNEKVAQSMEYFDYDKSNVSEETKK